MRILSLGAGVQSTTLLLLAAEGRLPMLHAAIFADTGWEPDAVYQHLERLEREVAQPGNIPVHRVSAGNIREDALDPAHRFASMPLFIRKADGSNTMIRRQCTAEYKLKPIKRKVRQLLGYPSPRPVPRGVYVEQWIGISRDEFGRAKDSGIQYLRSAFPLLDLDGASDGREGWTRSDCQRYLASRGFGSTPKSACIGCENPSGRSLLSSAYLHRSCRPLDQAPIDRVTAHEWAERQTDVFGQGADIDMEQTDPDGCSPWSCRSGQPVEADESDDPWSRGTDVVVNTGVAS